MTTEQRRDWHREIGQRIRAARRGLGLRQCDLGMWKERVCRIERGQVELDAREFHQLSRVLGAIEMPALQKAIG